MCKSSEVGESSVIGDFLLHQPPQPTSQPQLFVVGLAYQGKDIVLRFIIEYSSLRDFGPYIIGLFLYEDF